MKKRTLKEQKLLKLRKLIREQVRRAIKEEHFANPFYIVGYLGNEQIGAVDGSGKLNYSDGLDIDSLMYFTTREEAQQFADKLFRKEKKILHPTFKYEVEERGDSDYS